MSDAAAVVFLVLLLVGVAAGALPAQRCRPPPLPGGQRGAKGITGNFEPRRRQLDGKYQLW